MSDDYTNLLAQLPAAPRTLHYTDEAACQQTDTELFYSEAEDTIDVAKTLCLSQCAMQKTCLAWALDTREEFGIWGGYTAKERVAMRRQLGTLGRKLAGHATETSWRRGCRCQPCVEAHRNYKTARSYQQAAS